MRRLGRVVHLHRELNWCQIARECLRKKMGESGILTGIAKAKTLTVRQAISLNRTVKRACKRDPLDY